MRTVKVGFDYDEPIFLWCDYAHDASVLAGLTTADQPPPTVWDPSTVYGCELQAWFDAIDAEVAKGIDGMYARPVLPGVVEAIRRLYNQGYEVHIVTARGQFGTRGEMIKRLTKRQLIFEGIPYHSLTFTENKHKAIKRLGLDYFIDDRDKYYLEAEAAGARTYLLDRGWNQDFVVPADRRVYSTEEYCGIIMDREQLVRPRNTPMADNYAR